MDKRSTSTSELKRMPTREYLTDISFLILASFICFVALYPYWLFGELSCLGWYDEYDAAFPWYFAKSTLQDPNGFLHGYAGGTGGGVGILHGNEKLSFYRLLVRYLDLWVAQFLIRFLGMAFLFSGVYAFLRKITSAHPFHAFAGGLFSVLASDIPYGWTLGGLVWSLGGSAWLCVVCFAHFRTLFSFSCVLLLIVGIITVTCEPVFFPLFAAYTFAFCLCLFPQPCTLRTFHFALGLLLFVLLMVNWFDGLHALSITKEFAARVQGTLSPGNVFFTDGTFFEKLAFAVQRGLDATHQSFVRQPYPWLAAAYLFVCVLCLCLGELKKLILFLFLTIFFPVLLDISAKFSGVDFVERYRWNTLWLLRHMTLAIFIVYLMSILRERWGSVTIQLKGFLPRLLEERHLTGHLCACVLLMLTVAANTKILDYTLINFSADGGLGVVKNYKSLQKLQHSRDNYRFISSGAIRGVIPIFYGLDTFDGGLAVFSFRRSYFLAYAAYDPPRETLHTHRHFFYSFPNGFDTNIMRMANVGYVLSKQEVEHSQMTLLDSSAGLLANEIDYPLKRFLSQYFKHALQPYFQELSLVPSLFIHELKNPWPRVFAAQKVTLSPDSFRTKQYYQELKQVQRGEILVAQEDHPRKRADWDGTQALSVIDYQLHESGAVVQVAGTGSVVFNQVFTPSWTAECDGKAVELLPVNGIMMAARVPPGCTSVHFHYRMSS